MLVKVWILVLYGINSTPGEGFGRYYGAQSILSDIATRDHCVRAGKFLAYKNGMSYRCIEIVKKVVR